jgi:hypothetical protein
MTAPGEPVFYCTGRGTHDPPPALDRHLLTRGGTAIELRCPVCGCGPKRIGYRAGQRIADAGLTEVDISTLPF